MPPGSVQTGAMAASGPAPLALPTDPLHDDDRTLALRAWGCERGDAVALAAAWADPEIARWTAVPQSHDEAAAARWIAAEASRRAAGRALDLVVTGRDDASEVRGEVGLVVVDARRRWAEVGYWTAAPWRGRGLATTALATCSAWALAELPLVRLFARTAPGNPASVAVARRAGYGLAGGLADGTQVWVRDRR
ncbi:MAG: putative acetyltransferase [Acidimicrobiales bacterium]|nr:putative acetyltransferase [Acidimicrobiales bacterium]